MFTRTGPITWTRAGSPPHDRYYGRTADTRYAVEWRSGWWVASWWYEGEVGDLPPVEIGNFRDSKSAIGACAAREG